MSTLPVLVMHDALIALAKETTPMQQALIDRVADAPVDAPANVPVDAPAAEEPPQ